MGILRDMTWLHNFWRPLTNLLHSILGLVFHFLVFAIDLFFK